MNAPLDSRSTVDSNRIWQALEQDCALPQVIAVWQAQLADQYALVAPFLQPTRSLAAGYLCPRECGCVHEVISSPAEQSPSSRLVAVCVCGECLDPVLELTPAEVELRALCWTRLGRALCRALDLESKAAELGIRDTRQIGAWSVAAVPVLVTLEIEREVFGSVVASLANRLQRPFILLVPTHRALDARGYEALAQARAGCFALDSIVRFTAPGVLQPVRAPGELFQVFTPQPKELDQDLASRLRSLLGRLDGETFEVFRLYCIEALSAAEIARRCRTSKTTVLRRLKSLRQQTGVDPQQLRTLSPHLSNIPSICQTRRFC